MNDKNTPPVVTPSLELVSYQVTELKNLISDLSKDIKDRMTVQDGRLRDLSDRAAELDSRVKVLESQSNKPDPLPVFAKYALTGLSILSALVAVLWGVSQVQK